MATIFIVGAVIAMHQEATGSALYPAFAGSEDRAGATPDDLKAVHFATDEHKAEVLANEWARLNMTRLALNLSHYANGVSKRHGIVSRRMFPDYAIDSITNGVHSRTWTGKVWKKLYDEGKLAPPKTHFWETKPDEELYDLQSDPDETRNLAGAAEHQATLARLRKDYGLRITHAMSADINGHNWPLADVLLAAGIQTTSMAINEDFGGAPFTRPNVFRWQAPSGALLPAHHM